MSNNLDKVKGKFYNIFYNSVRLLIEGIIIINNADNSAKRNFATPGFFICGRLSPKPIIKSINC